MSFKDIKPVEPIKQNSFANTWLKDYFEEEAEAKRRKFHKKRSLYAKMDKECFKVTKACENMYFLTYKVLSNKEVATKDTYKPVFDHLDVLSIKIHDMVWELDKIGKLHVHMIVEFPMRLNWKLLTVLGFTRNLQEVYNLQGCRAYMTKSGVTKEQQSWLLFEQDLKEDALKNGDLEKPY